MDDRELDQRLNTLEQGINHIITLLEEPEEEDEEENEKNYEIETRNTTTK